MAFASKSEERRFNYMKAQQEQKTRRAMTPEEIDQFMVEMERRFRMRTPTMDANYINPNYRVGRSEMVTWVKETFGIQMDLVDTGEPVLLLKVKQMWKRLKKEFPDENW